MFHVSRRIPARAWPGALFLCTLLAACNAGPDSSGVTVTDSAGVRLLTSRGTGWGDDPAWHLELDLDVGERDGPNAFARLRDVAPRRGGGVWLLDSQARRVRGFDDAGSEILAFGRPGQGPGEFGFVDHVAELPDGEIVVGGSAPISLHRFGRDGLHRASAILPDTVFRPRPAIPDAGRPPAGPTFGRWQVAADGSVFVQTTVVEADGDAIARRDILFRLSADGGPAIRLAVWDAPLMEGGPTGVMRLLEPETAWSPLADGGIWLTSASEYELQRLDAAGRLTAVIRRPGSRDPVTEAIRRGVRNRLGRTMDSDFERALLDRAAYPDVLPATYGLWVAGSSGVSWVGVVDPRLPWDYESSNAWDVFGRDGTYVGRMPIPPGFRTTRVTGDHVYGIWLDDLDVPHARRYRIVRGTS